MPPIGRLHLVTDHRLIDSARSAAPRLDQLLLVVAAAVRGGVDTVQIRVSDRTTDREAYHIACQIRELCHQHQVTCLVNDRLDLALAVGAHGAHVGADDLPVSAARLVLGPAAIIGATVRSPEAARQAEAQGASYLGVGPAYPSSTKPDLPDPLGPTGLRAVVGATTLPVIAIGGITADRAAEIWNAGVYGIAVVGAISSAADPASAARALRPDSPRSKAHDGSQGR